MNRKEFLITTGLAGAALASHAWTPAMVPREKIRLGIIGTGARGQSHIDELLKRSDVEIISIADPDKKWAIPAALKIFDQYKQKKPQVFDNGSEDYTKLLDDKNLDAVIICTPWEAGHCGTQGRKESWNGSSRSHEHGRVLGNCRSR